MKKIILFTLSLFATIALSAQSYTIEQDQSSYDTLTSYRSVIMDLIREQEDPFLGWERPFAFDFSFPFFGQLYDTVFIDSDAYGIFPGSQDYNFELFGSAYEVDLSLVVDTPNIPSDVRYSNMTVAGTKALAVEYHSVYNPDELEERGRNHVINFQLWFYETGVIEVHFGDIDLDSCSYYFPGEGFSFDNTDPTDNIYGPWVGINTSGMTKAAGIFGDYANPQVSYIYDSTGVLTSIPPRGSIIRFVPDTATSIQDDLAIRPANYSISHTDGQIKIAGDMQNYRSCRAIDLTGRLIAQSDSREIYLDPGKYPIVILQIFGKEGVEAHKVALYR